MKVSPKKLLTGAGAALIGFTVLSGVFNVDANRSVRAFNNVTGEYTWYTSQGYHFKMPWVSQTDEIVSEQTIVYSKEESIRENASVVDGPLTVKFSDNYKGDIEGQFRVKLPEDSAKLEVIYQAFKSDASIRGNLYRPFAKNLLRVTANQFRAQDYMQGGTGFFDSRLKDQAENGILETQRVRELVEQSVADSSVDSKVKDKTAKQYIYVVKPVLDEDNQPIRRAHALTKYGIQVTEAQVIDFVPSPELEEYLNGIKLREKKKAAKVADQQLEREDAITQQMKWEKTRVVEQTQANIEKDKAVIAAEKGKALAAIKADQEIIEREKLEKLAVIDKRKEQSIAEANKGIQKANDEAATYEAARIRKLGMAEAEVQKAKYDAIRAEILISNNNKETALALYKSKMKVEMPQMLSIGGNASGDPIKNMSSLKLLEQLQLNTSK